MSDYFGHLQFGNSASSSAYILKSFVASGNALDLTVKVIGTSADDLADKVEALAALCGSDGVTYIHFEPGTTYPVCYDVAAALMGQQDASLYHTLTQIVSLSLTVSSAPSGALQSVYSAEALNAPGALSLATLLGTRTPSLDTTIDDASGNDMHFCLGALAGAEMTDDQTIPFTGTGARPHWKILASSLTWTTMSNGTGASFWSNSSRYTTSAAWQTAVLDTSPYRRGKYKLFARVAQAAGTGYVMTSDDVNMPIPVTRATPHLLEIGDVDLPVSDTAPGTASNLTFYVRSDGTNRLDVNAFLVIPMDLGLFLWHGATPTAEIDQLDVGPSGVFADGVRNTTDFFGDVLEPAILAAHCPELIATAQPTGNTFPTDWGKTDAACTADTNRFKVATATGSKWVWYAATALGTPSATPDEVYQVLVTRDVDSRSAGNAEVYLDSLDVDGTVISSQLLSSVGANDAAPVALTLYGKAHRLAARGRVRMGVGTGGNMTAYWSAAHLRRAPVQLLVVAEDAAGALDGSYVHPVSVSVKCPTVYEVGR